MRLAEICETKLLSDAIGLGVEGVACCKDWASIYTGLRYIS